jgi:hypothetical protein
MDEYIKEERKRAATKGEAYLRKEITWEEFIDEFNDSEDELVMILFDVIEHEPPRSGLFGVGDMGWQQYLDNIRSAIYELEESIK